MSPPIQSPHVTLPGSQREPMALSRSAGPVNRAEVASLTIRTRASNDTAALKAQVDALYAAPLAQRTYLTRDELGAQYGARPEDLDAIEHFAQAHSLIVSHRSGAERSLVLTGRLGDLLNAFPATVEMFHHPTGTYRGRRGTIQIPSQFDGVITGVFGYDTRPKHKRPRRQHAVNQSGPGGQAGLPATAFAARYNFPTKHAGKTLDGTGECIAIIELGGGFNRGDLEVFFHELKLPVPHIAAVSVDHAGNHPTANGDADGEVMLDIEVAGAVVPKANFAVYFAPNQGSGFLDAISAAVHDKERKPSVVSISWGGPEDPGDAQSAAAFHEIFVAAAALGVTICVAAGDHGVADLDAGDWDKKIHVDHPSVDDMVLACGGTQVDPATNADVVWNDSTPFNVNTPGGGGWAGGGGISTTVAMPSYQAGAHLPVSIDTKKPGRGVPDIAMSATDYFTRVHGQEGQSGGTSAVAPLMASLVALLNQAKGKPVGFLNPFLYAHTSLFKDVTSGNNGIADTVAGYSAGIGWDACTGLGCPDGTAILNAL